eukprot:Hpha_TRINITY_DN16752_c0_g1::TRINITY_DN16752_c0_g1_i1::g.77997::m.77997
MGCFQWMIGRDNDTEEERSMRKSILPPALFVMLFSFASALKALVSTKLMLALGVIIVCVSTAIPVCSICTSCRTSVRYLVDVFLVCSAVGICIVDWASSAYSTSFRPWAYVVLLLDVSLVYSRDHIQPFIITFLLLYLTAESVESAHRYGLYDMGFWGTSVEESSWCYCASPPCTVPALSAFVNFVSVCTVFLLDFYLTRRFSTGMREQLVTVESSVRVAAEVAAALARYDVETAADAIHEQRHLPPGLESSYLRLLANLKLYRDYLPEELLVPRSSGDGLHLSLCRLSSAIPPPMTPGEGGADDTVDVAMVFTDIQSSMVLWDAHPNDMYEALSTHNTTLRETARENSGYEVKIIGDALMLAFDSPGNALSFGVQAQLGLLNSQWPQGLQEHPLCTPKYGCDGLLLWSGLRVRIGIHYGPARVEKNPVTMRYDYFGTTVNIASRVEAILKHGGITGVTQAVMDEVEQGRLSGMYTVPMGARDLKGFSQPVFIHIVLPPSLAARWPAVQESVLIPEPQPQPSLPTRRRLSDTSCGSPTKSPMSDYTHTKSFSRRTLSDKCESPHSGSSGRSPFEELTHLGSIGDIAGWSPLDLGLSVSSATCVAVRCSFRDQDADEAEHALTRMLVDTETAALRTEGRIASVMSSVCLLSWNPGSRTVDHLAQSTHFLRLLRINACCGFATGSVLSGNVSGVRRRHVAVAGLCADLSVILSESALVHRLYIMAGGEAAGYLNRYSTEDIYTLVAMPPWREIEGGALEVVGAERVAKPLSMCEIEDEAPKRKLVREEDRRYFASFSQFITNITHRMSPSSDPAFL